MLLSDFMVDNLDKGLTDLYPLKFTPIFKEKIWGGNKLITYLNKNIEGNNIGESWELSGVENSVSVVANGDLAGVSLAELVNKYKANLLGVKVFSEFGYNFPLLVKFIDARDDLSVQVHPNNFQALEACNSIGKTEMWYVCQADENSQLIAGLTEEFNPDKFISSIDDGTFMDLMNVETVDTGDAFFIPAGAVHAIGKGVLLAEIQQSSDVTYRLYDYNRIDSDGNLRELHINQAFKVIDDKVNVDCRVNSSRGHNSSLLVSCDFFTVNLVNVKDIFYRSYSDIDSFVIYMCVEGSAKIEYFDNVFLVINLGETVLIPACFKEIKIYPITDAKILETYIK